MSEYRIENLRTGESEIFDTIEECREYVGSNDCNDFTIYELVRGDIENELSIDEIFDNRYMT